MFYKNLPVPGLEPRTSGIEATALPTEPQPLPELVSLSFSPLALSFYVFSVFQYWLGTLSLFISI